MAESGGLLNRCTPKGYHRFESCRLRHFKLRSEFAHSASIGCQIQSLIAFRFSALLPTQMTLRRSIVIYGLAMAALLALLKLIEYQFFIRDLSLEMYLGLVAVIFVVLGVWAGTRLTRVKIVKVDPDFEVDAEQVKRLGITKREYEVLCLIAAGLSNQEIADKLFVSTSTIKTHTSSIFQKLDASRRTQAIQKAKELRILR